MNSWFLLYGRFARLHGVWVGRRSSFANLKIPALNKHALSSVTTFNFVQSTSQSLFLQDFFFFPGKCICFVRTSLFAFKPKGIKWPSLLNFVRLCESLNPRPIIEPSNFFGISPQKGTFSSAPQCFLYLLSVETKTAYRPDIIIKHPRKIFSRKS